MVGGNPYDWGAPKIVEPDRLRLVDQQPQDAAAAGQFPDQLMGVWIDPGGDELDEVTVAATDDAQGGVLRLRELGCVLIRVSTLCRSRSDEIAVTASSRARAGPDRGAIRPVWTAARSSGMRMARASPASSRSLDCSRPSRALLGPRDPQGARVASGREPAQDR